MKPASSTGSLDSGYWNSSAALLNADLMLVSGTPQRENEVIHVLPGTLRDCSAWVDALEVRSTEFH